MRIIRGKPDHITVEAFIASVYPIETNTGALEFWRFPADREMPIGVDPIDVLREHGKHVATRCLGAWYVLMEGKFYEDEPNGVWMQFTSGHRLARELGKIEIAGSERH